MARICSKCHMVHPLGAVSCKDAARINKENAERFRRKVEHHMKHCRGCPDPEQHVRNLEELDNPRRKPIVFGERKGAV